VLILNKYEEIGDSEKHLLYKNRETYNDIIFYISTHKLKEDELYEIKRDILSIALNAQQRGELFSNVVGEEIKGFCDQIVAESDKKSIFAKGKDTILNIFLAIDIYIIIIIFMNAAIDVSKLTIFTLGHLLFIVITFAEFKCLLYVLKKKAVEKKRNDNYTVLGIVGLLIIVLSGILFVKFYNVKLFELKIDLLLIIVFITVLTQLLNFANRRKSILQS
jgi:DNA-binding ferritin-like protein (Dps family)